MNYSSCSDILDFQGTEMELMELGTTMLKQLATSLLPQESINIMTCIHGRDIGYILLINFWQFCIFSFRHLLCLFLLTSGWPIYCKDRLLMDGGSFLFHHVWENILELN